jgi:hypothetical protein
MNNHLSLQLIGTFKNTMTYDIRNPGPGLGQAQTYMAGLNCLMGSQHSC